MEGCHTGRDECSLDDVVENHWYFLVHILPNYPSNDMKIGIDVAQLILNPIALAAAKLDPRGMHFKHLDILPIIQHNINHDKFLAHIEKVVKEKNGRVPM